MQDMNWNYPTSIRFGLNRIKNIQEVCDELLIKNPLIVTDPGILQTDIIDKINSYFGYSFIKNIQIKILNSKFSSLKKNTIIYKKRGNFDYNLKKIEDINLKNKLQNLINAFNEKK